MQMSSHYAHVNVTICTKPVSSGIFDREYVAILWWFRICALLWLNPMAFLVLAPLPGTVFRSPCWWNYWPSHLPSSI